jgi:hypothetical protein
MIWRPLSGGLRRLFSADAINWLCITSGSMGTFFNRYALLNQYGISSNTNKATQWVNPDADYQLQKLGDGLLRKYEHFLGPIRSKPQLRILELGAGPDNNIGASMRCWKSFFSSDTELHVADIKGSALSLEAEGFHVHVCDLGSPEELASLAAMEWDFILDDASHFWSHQKLAFTHLFGSIKPGGVYIVEDLCTSFGTYKASYNPSGEKVDAATYFLALSRRAIAPWCALEDINKGATVELNEIDNALALQLDMVSMMENSCIIVKK